MPGKGLLCLLALALCLMLYAAVGLLPSGPLRPRHEKTRTPGTSRHLEVSPCVAAGVPVSLRINTSHALDNARGAVLDAGLSPVEVRISPSSPGSDSFLPPDRFIADAKSAGATILSSSFSGWQSLYDSLLYQKLTQNGMVHVYAYVPSTPQPENAPPPSAFVTVNRIGAKTGHGIEFGIPATYMNGKGQSSTPSGVTAQLAGLMACLKFQHPAWNWFDVKAALRQTAANYPTGYNPRNYGYGVVDYPAANALSDARQFPLFAPAAVLRPQRGNVLPFSINPFQQTRRAADALFKFRSAPALSLSELSLAEIMDRGGQLILLGDSTKSGSNSAGYAVTREELAYFVWFTRDAAGRFSRIEPYSVLGPVHLIPLQLYGPRIAPARELKLP
jgi:hypothetical protein